MKIHLIATICAALAALCVLSAPVLAQKTARECTDEWRANKAANQAAHITEKDFVAKCRTAAAPAATAPQPAAKTATPPAAAPAPKTAATPKAPPATTGLATGTGEFKTEALAKASCRADNVVWANLNSKIYHFAGNRDYGTTKDGAYMCEKSALAQGIRAAKNEKRP